MVRWSFLFGKVIMKHFVNILSFLALGLVSCTSCTKTDTTTPVCNVNDCGTPSPPPDAALPPVVLDAGKDAVAPEPLDLPPVKFSGADWEFSTPSGWFAMELEDEEVKPEIMVVNLEEHNLILITKDLNQKSTAEYVLSVAKGFHEDGVTIHSTTPTELNGRQYMLLDTSKDGAHMWFWVTVQNNVAYSLSCGGAEEEDHHEGICKEVASTFKIK